MRALSHTENDVKNILCNAIRYAVPVSLSCDFCVVITQLPFEGPGVLYSKKKRVSWAEEDNLVMVHYFEMDESERGD